MEPIDSSLTKKVQCFQRILNIIGRGVPLANHGSVSLLNLSQRDANLALPQVVLETISFVHTCHKLHKQFCLNDVSHSDYFNLALETNDVYQVDTDHKEQLPNDDML